MATSGPGRRQSVTVIPQTTTPLYDAFTFDAITDASVDLPGSVFSHPIQSGAEGITDAVSIESPVFSVTGLTANTPAIPLLGFLPFSGGIQTDRMIEAVELLEKIRDAKIPVTVLCSWRRPMYTRWIPQMGLSRSSTSGNTINVTASFHRLRITQQAIVPQLQDSDILAIGQQVVELGQIPVF